MYILLRIGNILKDWARLPILMNLMKKGSSPGNLAPTANSPLVSGISQQEETTHLLARVPSTRGIPDDGLSEQLSASNWTASPFWKETMLSFWYLQQAWNIVTLKSDYLREGRFVCEGREENTTIFWSTRIRFCLLSLPLLQPREKARSWITVRVSGAW